MSIRSGFVGGYLNQKGLKRTSTLANCAKEAKISFDLLMFLSMTSFLTTGGSTTDSNSASPLIFSCPSCPSYWYPDKSYVRFSKCIERKGLGKVTSAKNLINCSLSIVTPRASLFQ